MKNFVTLECIYIYILNIGNSNMSYMTISDRLIRPIWILDNKSARQQADL